MSPDKFRKKRIRGIFACTILIASAVVAAPTVLARRSPFEPLTIFARAFTHVETGYVEPVDQQRLVYGAIRGMLDALDPHSAFLDPEEYRMLEADAEGRFAGVGVEVAMRDGWLTVLAVFDEGPAAAAGLRPGDRFLSIDGEDARDIRLYDAVRRMRGPPGTQVEVEIRRPGEEAALERTLTRAFIEVTPVEVRFLEQNAIYVRIETFSENTASLLRDSLDAAAEKLAESGGIRGVLLDLRDNAGGLLQQAVQVSDEFLSSGVIVTTRDRGGQEVSEFRARRGGTRPDWPLVALINEHTASAAEIVAGALKDHDRAILVGVRSFGKGSVQDILELPDGSAVKLTIARYFTPSGSSIQATGIQPDYEASQPKGPELSHPVREEELDGHLPASAGPVSGKRSRATLEAPIAVPGQSSRILGDDPQAQRAFQLLRREMGRR